MLNRLVSFFFFWGWISISLGWSSTSGSRFHTPSLLDPNFYWPEFKNYSGRLLENETVEIAPSLFSEGTGVSAQAPSQDFGVSYFGVFYSPPFQASPGLESQSLVLRNFLGLNYRLSDDLTLSGTAFWTLQSSSQQFAHLQDPFLRVSDNSLFHLGNLNLYVDGRVHFPVSPASRSSQLLLGVQSVQVLNYPFGESRFSIGSYSSIRYNFFGTSGVGSDYELYFAPTSSYQLSPTVALTLLYEMQLYHYYRDRFTHWSNFGTDLEPGVNIDISPSLSVNPYFHIPIANKTSLSSSSVGMMVSWILM